MRIDGYEILGELGKGGAGVVYRARQVDLDREVALKRIKESDPSEQAVRRFVREVELAGRLGEHPGIVRIHGAGQTPDGDLYYAMELVRGRSLREAIPDGGLPVREAVRYVALVAEAVHHAHEEGVVHRDLAPKNVIVDERDLPRVLDFGMARPLTDATRLTRTGAIVGTPRFMAPEQIEDARTAGPAADVYALGATLYACLAGRPPFRASGTLINVLQQVLLEEPDPLGEARPDVPGPLAEIVRRAMAKDPADRHPSAAALAEDLRAFARGEAIAGFDPAAGLGGLRRVVAGALVVAAVLLAGAFAWLGVPGALPTGEGPSAVPPGAPPSGGPETGAARAGREVDRALAVLRDPARAGPVVSRAVRTLLPRAPDDPRDPFVGGLPGGTDDGPAAPVREAIERLADAAGQVPGRAWAPLAAAHVATTGRDGPVLASAPPAGSEIAPFLLARLLPGGDPALASAEIARILARARRAGEARELLARLHLLRAEPDRALAALADRSAPLLRGLAHLLEGRAEPARRALEGTTGPVEPRARRLLAALSAAGAEGLPADSAEPGNGPDALADALLDAATRDLFAADRAPGGRVLGRVRLRARVARALDPGSARAAVLLAGLETELDHPLLAPGGPVGWGKDGGDPAAAAAWLGQVGSDLDTSLGIARAVLHERGGDGTGAAREAARLLTSAGARGPGPRPRTHALRAVLLLEAGRTDGAARAAVQALDAYQERVSLYGGGRVLLRLVEEVLLAANHPDADRARAALRGILGSDEEMIRRAFTDPSSPFHEPEPQRNVAPGGLERFGADPAILASARRMFARVGEAWPCLFISVRLLHIGRWSALDDLPAVLAIPAAQRSLRELRRRPDPVAESLEQAAGLVLARTVDPDAGRARIARGVEEAGRLVALGVVPAPLLAVRGYGRLRLGDPRGARADALAVLRRGVSAGLPRLVLAVASTRLGEPAAAVRALEGCDPEWLAGVLETGGAARVPPRITRDLEDALGPASAGPRTDPR